MMGFPLTAHIDSKNARVNPAYDRNEADRLRFSYSKRTYCCTRSRASRTLEIVPKFRVVFDALWIGAFYPLASYAGPERAGLIRSVDIENVQTFAAGADRNAAVASGRPHAATRG